MDNDFSTLPRTASELDKGANKDDSSPENSSKTDESVSELTSTTVKPSMMKQSAISSENTSASPTPPPITLLEAEEDASAIDKSAEKLLHLDDNRTQKVGSDFAGNIAEPKKIEPSESHSAPMPDIKPSQSAPVSLSMTPEELKDAKPDDYKDILADVPESSDNPGKELISPTSSTPIDIKINKPNENQTSEKPEDKHLASSDSIGNKSSENSAPSSSPKATPSFDLDRLPSLHSAWESINEKLPPEESSPPLPPIPSNSTALPIPGWNWGAFLLNWIWAIGNHIWIGLFALVPLIYAVLSISILSSLLPYPLIRPLGLIADVIGFVISVVLGLKGSEWAWRHRRIDDPEGFVLYQRSWTRWSVIVIILIILVGAGIAAWLINQGLSENIF